MSNITQLPAVSEAPAIEAETISSTAMILDDRNFERILKFAELMSTAAVSVPQHLRGKPGDCLAVAMQAMQWKMNPFAVAQKTHFVNGAIGYEAQLVNAVVQESGAIVGRFSYEYRGDGGNVECRVGAIIRGEKEIIWSEWLSAATVKVKNSPLWQTNPKQQLGYLQVKNWARAYCPGAILGVYTADELEDIQPPAERDMGAAEVVEPQPKPGNRTSALKDQLGVGKGKKAAPPPPAITLPQVLDAILAMTTERATRDHAKGLAEQLTSQADIDKATDAWKARMEAIKTAAEGPQAQTTNNVDPATGEILPPQPEHTGETADFVAAMERAEQAQGGGA